MPVNLDDVIRKLNSERRKKVAARTARLVAEELSRTEREKQRPPKGQMKPATLRK